MNHDSATAPRALSSRALRNGRVFARLTEAALRRFDAGRFEEAANMAELSAQFACWNHPGTFASAQLEAVLRSIGRQALCDPGRTRPSATKAANIRHVLHVFSEVYEVGGHTRLAARWISADANRRHDIVTTRPLTTVPSDLFYAVTRSNGRIVDLSAEAHTLLRRAEELLKAVLEADVVILHSHPDDAVPSLALGGLANGPPVATVNHADHRFWLGASLPDVLICFRSAGATLAVQRRGFDRGQLVSLPLPLPSVRRKIARQAAKEELSLRSESVVLLTIATEYKFESLEKPTFLDLLTDELFENPSLVLLAVGPTARGQWLDLMKRLPGRVFAVGPVVHPFLYRQAADIYLDSFPLGSATSLLESALLETPVLAYTPERLEDSVAFADLESLNDVLRAGSVDEYRHLLRRLAVDHAFRADAGRRLCRSVNEIHASERWRDHVETVYERLASAPRRDGGKWANLPDEASSLVDWQLVRIGPQRNASVVTLEVLAARGTEGVNAPVVSAVTSWTLRLRHVLYRLGLPERVLTCLSWCGERAALLLVAHSGRLTGRQDRRMNAARPTAPCDGPAYDASQREKEHQSHRPTSGAWPARARRWRWRPRWAGARRRV